MEGSSYNWKKLVVGKIMDDKEIAELADKIKEGLIEPDDIYERLDGTWKKKYLPTSKKCQDILKGIPAKDTNEMICFDDLKEKTGQKGIEKYLSHFYDMGILCFTGYNH